MTLGVITYICTYRLLFCVRMLFCFMYKCHLGPMLVMCGGKCTGARAAKARYERQAQRRKKLGKKPLDKNWRNSSYACTCDTE